MVKFIMRIKKKHNENKFASRKKSSSAAFVSRCSMKKAFCEILLKFTRKHLSWSPFFMQFQAWPATIFFKIRLQHRCFPMNFKKFHKIAFSKNTSGQLFQAVLPKIECVWTFSEELCFCFGGIIFQIQRRIGT